MLHLKVPQGKSTLLEMGNEIGDELGEGRSEKIYMIHRRWGQREGETEAHSLLRVGRGRGETRGLDLEERRVRGRSTVSFLASLPCVAGRFPQNVCRKQGLCLCVF